MYLNGVGLEMVSYKDHKGKEHKEIVSDIL